MKVVEPSVSTASRWRTSTLPLGHLLRTPGQRQRHGRQQGLGHERDGHPDGEHEPVARAVAEQHRDPEEERPDGDRDAAIVPHHPVRGRPSAGSPAWPLTVVNWAIVASRVLDPMAVTIASPVPSTTNVPANTRVADGDRRRARSHR